MRTTATLFLFILTAQTVTAASIEKIGPAADSRVGFRHMVHNDNGDFVAVSSSTVFVGNGPAGTMEQIFQDDRTTFLLEQTSTLTVGTENINVDMEYYGTKVAINPAGDFILASRRTLMVGNARTKSLRQVILIDNYDEIEKVSIHADGYYIALAAKDVYGGHISDAAAKKLVTGATGSFIELEFYVTNNAVSAAAGKTLVSQGSGGDFIVAASGSVYGGNIASNKVVKLLDERWIDVRHVSLADNGDFVLATYRSIYRGSIRD